jgi:transposase
MKRFIQGQHRGQGTLLPESLDDYVSDSNPVRVVDVFVDELDLVKLGFEGIIPADTGRPAYHPAILLKIYIYGYLNRIQSSRRLEREAQRNIELMWLTGRLMPDFKTIANFRKDNGKAIRGVCRQFVVLCQQLGLFSEALLAIDGSKFKAVNNRDRNFISAKLRRRMEEIESSINRYLTALDTADRGRQGVSPPISLFGARNSSRRALSTSLLVASRYPSGRSWQAGQQVGGGKMVGRESQHGKTVVFQEHSGQTRVRGSEMSMATSCNLRCCKIALRGRQHMSLIRRR